MAGLAALGLAVLSVYEWRRNSRITELPARPPREYKNHIHHFLTALEKDAPFDAALLEDTFLFIQKRYDCADFWITGVLRALYAYGDKLEKYRVGLSDDMKNTVLGFKYHWDQKGRDSLCTWSENHQILFAGAEYLAGHLYENEIFTNSGRKGRYHKQRGKKRILMWCTRRFKYGFTEWYSNNYYREDVAAMSNIQEFAPDGDVRNAITQIMHMIFFDMATQSFKGSFVSTGGRMYEDNKKSGRLGSKLNGIIAHAFEMDRVNNPSRPHGIDVNFLLNKAYALPEVIKQIAHDTKPVIIKASNSMDINEGIKNGVFGPGDEQLAAQWEMGAFTNHQVYKYTMSGVLRNDMLCSQFFTPLKKLNFTIMKPFYNIIAKVINPVVNGKATQRANTYTYRTPHYLMATAQKYQPGGFCDQQHIWHVTLSHDVCVFATHPAGELEESGALSNSPGYWVGNGRNPHAMQHENKILAIYHLPEKKASYERKRFTFTHAYFPMDKFDRVILDSTMAFGKLNETYIALISATPFEVSGGDELKQYGKKQFWVCECSSSETESFADFVKRIRACKVGFDGRFLRWGDLNLKYKGDFYLKGCAQLTQYKRYDSPYCIGERDADAFIYQMNGETMEVRL